jgi:hypothetical protein
MLLSLTPWGAVAMRRRGWRIEWRVRPQADGLERLSRAVRLLVDRAIGDGPSEPMRKRNDQASEELAEGEHA